MSLRPVDLQIIIPRATDVGKTQQLADKNIMSQQEQSAEQWQQISASRQQKVQSTPPVEGNKVQKDKEKENQGKNAHQGHHLVKIPLNTRNKGKKSTRVYLTLPI
ncbi:MAG: hypothetical protein PHQ46_13855, partial [Negativicutes bacterium]|nr:hypothetical protein [Negativicutes bacterium]